MISQKRGVYLFKNSSYTTSYDTMLTHGVVFNLTPDRARLLGLREEDFILEAIPKILSLTNSCVFENHILEQKKQDCFYRSIIENNDIDICVDKISDAGMEKLKGIIDKHNEKFEEKDNNKRLVLGGNYGKTNNGKNS